MNVWVYWQGYKAPYIDLCITTIKKYSNGLNFVLLDDNSITKYLNLPATYTKLSVVHRADYIRVALIHKYGGIWLDADTIVLKPLIKYTKFLDKYKFLSFGKPRSPQTAIVAGRSDSAILFWWFNYIHRKINESNITWGDLGPIALKSILKNAQHVNNLKRDREYYNIPPEYCAPIPCKDWKRFLSNRVIENDIVPKNVGFVMLYNRFMKYKLGRYDKDYLLKSDILISKLFRRSLKL